MDSLLISEEVRERVRRTKGKWREGGRGVWVVVVRERGRGEGEETQGIERQGQCVKTQRQGQCVSSPFRDRDKGSERLSAFEEKCNESEIFEHLNEIGMEGEATENFYLPY